MMLDRVEELFTAAQDLDPEARDAFLQKECGDDFELQHEVVSLLTAANASRFYFDNLAARVGLAALSADDSDLPHGGQIGPWRLLRVIGRGGMGTVYLAERADDQFDKRAALKILPKGLGAAGARTRFMTERQILARLEHENIARLLDGGLTDDGTPYFVMDYVDGVAIDEFCDQSQLTINRRLELFLDVCGAVQYAHRNLIVHRDIKPGNVLVEPGGRPRLLDFGIAKILEPTDPSANLTQFVQRPLTLAYASPEMVRGEPVDVTSDVYSLGVLLYVLLTGRPPLRFGGLSPGEVEMRALNTMPRPASEAIVIDDEPDTISAADRAERRGSTPKTLRAMLQGDLDTVIAKALAKDRLDRYESVGLFAQDIRNHMEGLPVVARPASLAYRTRKFVSRHKVGVSFAAIAAAMLVAIAVLATLYAVTTEQQSAQIAEERDRLREITTFMVGVFESADPDHPAADRTAREILEQGRTRVSEELSEQPETQAELLKAISQVYNGMRMVDAAEETMLHELRLREQLTGTETPEYAEVLIRLAQNTDNQGKFDLSRQYAERALTISTGLDDRVGQARAHVRIGRIAHLRGDYDVAGRHFHESLSIYKAEFGEDGEDTLKVKQHLANLFNHQGDYPASVEMFEDILETRERIWGPEHSEIGPVLLGLGSALLNSGKHDDATAAYDRAFALNENLYGPDNPRNMYIVNGLGKVAQAQGDHDVAAKHFAEAGRLVKLHFGDDNSNFGITRKNLAEAYRLSQRYELSVPMYREALSRMEKHIPDHWYVGDTRWRLGSALTEMNRFEEAEALILSGIDIVSNQWGLGHESTRSAYAAAVTLYERMGKSEEAKKYRSTDEVE